MDVKKIPALLCPQCKSDRVSPGFNQRIGNAWVRDKYIYCEACKLRTNTQDGKAETYRELPRASLREEESPFYRKVDDQPEISEYDEDDVIVC